MTYVASQQPYTKTPHLPHILHAPPKAFLGFTGNGSLSGNEHMMVGQIKQCDAEGRNGHRLTQSFFLGIIGLHYFSVFLGKNLAKAMPQRILFFAFSLLLCAHRATAGDTLRLYFPTNISDLQPRAIKSLDSALYYNALSPDSALEILGYTDFVGSEAYNDSLSLRRAETVKGYLIQNGFSERKLLRTIAKGELPAGMKMPTNGIAAHRRVDIILNGKTGSETLLELGWKPEPQTVAKTKVKPQPKLAIKPEPPPTPVAKLPILPSKEKPLSTATQRIIDVVAKTPVGGSFQLSKLFFPSGSHEMYPTSVVEMNELLTVMQETPTLRIRVEGHVCCIDTSMAKDALDEGTNEYRLSDNRARVVAQFLVRNGIPQERVSFIGFGKRFPIVAHEKTAEEAAANRRVEIRVLEK